LLLPVEPADLLRIAELVARYGDLPLGTVDASIVAAAERLNIRTVATLDRRDFAAVRPAHVDCFELVP
jgi:predicted nucleic acid-binding protein